MASAGAIRTAIGASLLSGIAYVLLLFCASDATFLLSACLLGVGQGVFMVCMQFEAVTAAPAERTGVAIGTYQLANDLALGLGSSIWGLVVDSFGYSVMFVGCIVCIAISIPMAAALGKRTASQTAGA
jgi:predicted MFS family arabinose efflux permease